MTPQEWIVDLYGSPSLHDMWLTVCWRENRLKWHHVPLSQPERAANGIDLYGSTTCVWTGCSPLLERPQHGRGGSDNTGALIGVWADIDFDGPGHRQRTGLPLPSGPDDAHRLLADVQIPATHIVHSGGGFQVWWLFSDPWVFTDDGDRLSAQALSSGFGATIQHHAERHGWHVDDVSDLARILRPVGSWNRKPAREPKQVERVGGTGHRVLVADVEDIIVERPPTAAPAVHMSPDTFDGPASVFAQHTRWDQILPEHGWRRFVHSNGQRAVGSTCPTCQQRVEMWSHGDVATDGRGHPDHPSATACHVLYLFSDSQPNGLPARQPLTKFRTWALLNHGGNLSDAARHLLSAVNGGAR